MRPQAEAPFLDSKPFAHKDPGPQARVVVRGLEVMNNEG